MAGKLQNLEESVQHAQVQEREALAAGNMNAYRAWMIRKARLTEGISQEELAKRMGIQQSQIARLENVDYEGQQLLTILQIAKALGRPFVPPRIEAIKPVKSLGYYPPIVLDFTPSPEEILSQIKPSFAEEAKQRLSRFPYFEQTGSDFIITTRHGKKVNLSDAESRSIVSQMGQLQYWELMNIAEFLFKWNKDLEAKPMIALHTTHFEIEFFDYERAYEFFSEMAGKWEDWGKEGSNLDGGRSTACRMA